MIEYGSWDWYDQRVGKERAFYAAPCPIDGSTAHLACEWIGQPCEMSSFRKWADEHIDFLDAHEVPLVPNLEIVRRVAAS